MSEIGTCCSVKDAIEYIGSLEPRDKHDEMPMRIVNRLRYIQAKDEGVKPKFHKGIYSREHDYWTCGHCGTSGLDVIHNYCWNCGYKILWDSTRCLTK